MIARVSSVHIKATGTFLLWFAATLICLASAGAYLEAGAAGITELTTSQWNIILVLFTAGLGLVLQMADKPLAMLRFKKRPGPNEADKFLSLPEAKQMVQSFGVHLGKHSSRQKDFLDVSELPYSKAKIEQAIFALLVDANPAERDALCDGLVLLAFYQEGVDEISNEENVEQLVAACDQLKIANDETLEKLPVIPTSDTTKARCSKQLIQLRDADVARYEKIWESTAYPQPAQCN